LEREVWDEDILFILIKIRLLVASPGGNICTLKQLVQSIMMPCCRSAKTTYISKPMILICTVHTLIGRVVPSSRAEYYDNDKNLAEISDFVSEAESETPFFPYMRLSYCNLPIASFSSTMYL